MRKRGGLNHRDFFQGAGGFNLYFFHGHQGCLIGILRKFGDELHALKFLYDMLHACDLLDDFMQGRPLEAYLDDPLLQSAVERQLIIVGEALSHALRIEPTLEQAITDARLIVGFRNVMVHGYASIKPDAVWGVVDEELVILRREVEALLAAADSER